MDETIKSLYYNNSEVYPLTAFPLIMRNAIESLHRDCGVPMSMIGSVMLASASLTCQSLIDVVLPYDKYNKGSCALFLLVLAESGGRKSTIFTKIMSPFDRFSSRMKADYNRKLQQYDDEMEAWTEYSKDLRILLRKTKSTEERDELWDEIKEHRKNKPLAPRRFHLRYGNTTEASLAKGLMDYPYGGIITDEAINFFKGNIVDLLGFLNGVWDGVPQPFDRLTKNIDQDITAWMTILLMVQPKIFDTFMKKNDEELRNNGFVSRFIIDVQPRNKYIETSLDYSESDAAIAEYNNRIEELLKVQETKFNNFDDSKISLHLSEEAKKLWQSKNSEIDKKRDIGQEWENINDIASKASNNAIRIAAIFTRITNDECTIINLKPLENAYRIVEWHLQQANKLFFKDSPQELFINDVISVFEYIKEKFRSNGGMPFSKNDLTQKGVDGPRKLRCTKQLDPILSQLVSLKKIVIITNKNRAIYIVKPKLEAMYNIYEGNIYECLHLPYDFLPLNSIARINMPSNTQGKYSNNLFDPQKLQY
ncbi:YfjI family protein [Escherichia coli]|uniref:DUF3987 domain-containing protein n=1 Tax=Salmonella enterica TaxID=28901 RepID=A0A624MJJ8_SALER|nr:YfjI family protein [Escherichia coli]EBF9516829.1 DUF3987 domain-containing protein [Salmonella enterica subsp. enterica serovar Kingston]ECC3760725.1 DUF3987 domain-containing protein [Salmonella enterica]ECK7274225.1 DUF3987 domain-containing protein [Salmonella enterica subsp. enterica serovar Budapest]ECZ6321807.1 DUF3987 domain-containing protein [Salmonella enterica]EJF7193591.1 DUF3987 domain-containing protein [Salmonella enterica]